MVKLTEMCTRTSFNSMPFTLSEHLSINQHTCYTAKRVKNCLDDEGIEILYMASPVSRLKTNRESIGDHRRERSWRKQLSTTNELWNKLMEEWHNITPELCHKLVTSCGRRCAQAIRSKGLYFLLITEENKTFVCPLNCMFNCVLCNYDVPVL